MSATHRRNRRRGTTLLEMTIVIMVLLVIIGVSMYSSDAITTWKKGREATESLRAVYAAQRSFLADNPTRTVASLTAAELIPYLPSGAAAMPTVETLDGAALPIDITVSPPVIDDGTATGYDPSGSTSDSLWDVGE